MTEDKLDSKNRGGLTQISDDELEVVVGGLRSSSSGKWIITPNYSCIYFMKRQGVPDRHATQCTYCRYQERENLIIWVCGNSANT